MLLTQSWKDKGFLPFPKSICPKVNVIEQLEFELTYNDSIVSSISRLPTVKKNVFEHMYNLYYCYFKIYQRYEHF